VLKNSENNFSLQPAKMSATVYEITGPLQRSRSNYYKPPMPPAKTYESFYMDEKYAGLNQPLPPTPPAPLQPQPQYQSSPPSFQDAAMVTIPADMFDRMFLKSQESAAGKNAHRQFANPTPLSVVGFLLALSPLSCDLMGWRGAGGNGAASMYVFALIGGSIS
jgi:hypothetical protein